jgi:hypothetical protein
MPSPQWSPAQNASGGANMVDNQTSSNRVLSTAATTVGNNTVTLNSGNNVYPIKYHITGGNATGISGEKDNTTLVVNISSTSNGKLTNELPRNVIDSKQRNRDANFVVFEDGQYSSASGQIKNNT